MLGGANLAIWPLSEIGQRNGIVFIRREFRDDHVYRAVLRAYLAHLIETRQNLEWYFEGGRTRTGKLRPPAAGRPQLRHGRLRASTPSTTSTSSRRRSSTTSSTRSGAISAEEMGGTKKPESLKLAVPASPRRSRGGWARAYLRFGEPLSLRDAVALTADENGQVRPRLAVPKVAFENANRINAVTPITPGALITYALLDNGGRAITRRRGPARSSPPLARLRPARGTCR